MKTHSTFSAVQENLRAANADISNRQRMARTRQMCWKCQNDKPLKGGSIKFFGTLRRFICADCIAAKEKP